MATNRNAIPDELTEFQNQDLLSSWPDFLSTLKDSDIIVQNSLILTKSNENICLCALNTHGDICLRITISPNFTVSCFKYHTKVCVRDLLGFQQTLKSWSQLMEIINRCKNATISLENEITGFTQSLMQTLEEGVTIYDPMTKFLLSQIQLLSCSPTQRR